MEGAHEYFSQALEVLDFDNWIARVMCLSGLTQQALLRGELDVAHARNRQALCCKAQGSRFSRLLELEPGNCRTARRGTRAKVFGGGLFNRTATEPQTPCGTDCDECGRLRE